tara:strand:- start:475 stop:678 length:204 start_codon:yes stop_codon:yes gene_type:complete
MSLFRIFDDIPLSRQIYHCPIIKAKQLIASHLFADSFYQRFLDIRTCPWFPAFSYPKVNPTQKKNLI